MSSPIVSPPSAPVAPPATLSLYQPAPIYDPRGAVAAPPAPQGSAPLPQPQPGMPYAMGTVPMTQPVLRWRNLMIIDRYGPPLRVDRCVRCNGAAERTIRKNLAWARSTVTLGLFLLLVVLPFLFPLWLLFYMFSQERAAVEYGTCEDCRQRELLWKSILMFFLLGSMPVMLMGFIYEAWGFGFGGLATLLGSAIAIVGFGKGLLPKKINKRWIHLKGAGKDFLAMLPSSAIPPG